MAVYDAGLSGESLCFVPCTMALWRDMRAVSGAHKAGPLGYRNLRAGQATDIHQVVLELQ